MLQLQLQEYIKTEIDNHQEIIDTLKTNDLTNKDLPFQEKVKNMQELLMRQDSIIRHEGAVKALQEVLKFVNS